MKTKVTILGSNDVEQPEKKKIEFCRVVCADEISDKLFSKPSDYDNIELICKNYVSQYDLLFAYNATRFDSVCYLGHFNDGIA